MTSVECVLQVGYWVLADHTGRVEPLCPGDERTSVDGRLQHREGEREAELDLGVTAHNNLVLIHYCHCKLKSN